MEDFQEKKRGIEQTIVETIITALRQGILTTDEFTEVSAYVLEEADKATNQEELLTFLRGLSGKWTIFTPILVMASGEAQKRMERDVLDGMLTLAKDGQIDEAVSLAKSVTEL